ncbi:MAG: hypothetical protein IJ461_09305, partial [Clostridia bacterium]|nr:hypothetical protein [Clostridia bacterium]
QEPISILGISESNGQVDWDAHQQQVRRQVFKPSTAWLTIDMMKDSVSSGTSTKAKISGQTVAGKTGTNSSQKGVTFCGLTGHYAASVWIGHDNYKELSSKATGGNSAAPLWQSFMSKIHKQKGLGNRDILEGDPADYGLTKVTTCAVSGQLATSACRNDVKGYGTVTDYWPNSNVPITECQMHKTMTICNDSKLLATQYCPNVSQSGGVIIIPKGHPLYRLIGTQYDDTLTEYLGSFATLRYTNDPNQNAALNSLVTCSYHTEHTTSGTDYLVENTLLPDARRLIQQAYTLLGRHPSGTDAYNNLQSAIYSLEGLINASPSSGELTQAMTRLTQAMAGMQ